MKKRPRIGIALSGGAARCIAHIGVLEVLESEEIAVDLIAGTSGGALVGALYASGMPLRELRDLALRLSWREMLKPSFSRKGLIPNKNLLKYITGKVGQKDFKTLKIPLAVVAADLKTGEKIVMTEGSLPLAVTASCSLPVIFSPLLQNGRILADGGIASNLPVLALIENLGATVTIAVDVNERANTFSRMNNLFQIGFHTVTLFAKKNAEVEKRHADVRIDVDASGVSPLELKKGALMIRRGRAAAEKQIPLIKKCLDELPHF